MTKIKNIKTVEFISIVVSFLGLVVMAGWYLEIEVLKSILPIWVSMEFTTALSFFISGIILNFVYRIIQEESTLSQTILIISTLILWLIMITFLLSTFMSTNIGIENLFTIETVNAVKTPSVGRPSIGTLLSFMSVASVGAIGMNGLREMRLYIYIIGMLLISVAFIAILGYIISVPQLYYYSEEYGSGMAVHTAILFLLIGIGFYIIGKSRSKKYKE